MLIRPQNLDELKLFLDSQTMMPVKVSHKSTPAAGKSMSIEIVFSDFREVGDVVLPFGSTIYQDGQESQELVTTELEINGGVEDQDFVVDHQ